MSAKILNEREEAFKPLKKVINHCGGDDVAEPYCLPIFEEIMQLKEKKPKFAKKDFKYLKGTDCWQSVKDIHKTYTDSWKEIKEVRNEIKGEVMEMVDVMDELEFNPFTNE